MYETETLRTSPAFVASRFLYRTLKPINSRNSGSGPGSSPAADGFGAGAAAGEAELAAEPANPERPTAATTSTAGIPSKRVTDFERLERRKAAPRMRNAPATTKHE